MVYKEHFIRNDKSNLKKNKEQGLVLIEKLRNGKVTQRMEIKQDCRLWFISHYVWFVNRWCIMRLYIFFF